MFPFPTYIYPDGVKSVRKPKDGEVFQVVKNNSVDSTWQYDDVMAKWVNITAVRKCSVNTSGMPQSYGYIYPPTHEEDKPIYDDPYPGVWEPKCECGSDSLNHPGHSHWCKKYTDKR